MPIQPSLSNNFSNKTVRNGIFGLGMAPKEILSLLLNPFNLKISDLFMETQLWSPLICEEKALHGGVDILDYVKRYTFDNFVYINNTFCFLLLLSYCHFIRLYLIIIIVVITQINIIIIFTIIIYYYH